MSYGLQTPYLNTYDIWYYKKVSTLVFFLDKKNPQAVKNGKKRQKMGIFAVNAIFSGENVRNWKICRKIPKSTA